ncbi:cob(I)yrinic acid a,c-diamide adenosyltransferase [bacterium]|nr:cob(I)yrinic acid a,c-diamide adenosyltransferase [bacterium]
MAQEENKLYNPDWAKHGYIQVYTGDGKGKTTASLGLCMRALGRNWKVLLVMFTKGGDNYGELISFKKLSPEINDNLTVLQAGLDRIVYSDNVNKNDETEIQKGWKVVKDAIRSNSYNLIIMDEANIALDLGLIDLQDMLETLKNKPEEMEIVLTGRNAKPEIVDIAHLVSKIEPVKHYWDTGVVAREGIEY